MRHARDHRLSIEDYLARENGGEVRHEYVAGEAYAMTGASPRHNIIAGNVFARLRERTRGGPCRVFISDMKLRVEAADAFYYPDVLVTCELAGNDARFMTDPCALVEVLSPSTASIDRREKLLAYRSLPSLGEYVIVDPRRRHVLVHRREHGVWHALLLENGDDQVVIGCLDTPITLDDIYEDVALPDVCEPWEEYVA